jgi:predicted ABC-type ATPase
VRESEQGRAAGVARVYVLAGVNGAGKSSIGGAAFRAFGADYYNPDEAARALREANPSLTQTQANAAAWQQGKRLLEHAIAARLDFAFETTLGASTIPRLLAEAASRGIEVRVWYAGLPNPELHITRVRQRVRKGGHDIPEADIQRRYRHSRMNLINLLPSLAALRVYDNSAEADPAAGLAPIPRLVLHMEHGQIVGPSDLSQTPEWAKPIVAAALRLTAR